MNFVRYLHRDDAATLSQLAEHLFRLGDQDIVIGETLADIVATANLLPAGEGRKQHVALYSEVI